MPCSEWRAHCFSATRHGAGGGAGRRAETAGRHGGKWNPTRRSWSIRFGSFGGRNKTSRLEARRTRSALRRTLEAVSRAAFLVSPSAVVSANSQGAAALDREGDSLRTRLHDVVRTLASNNGYDVTPAGPPGQFVVVRHGASDDIAGRFARDRPFRDRILGQL